MSKVGEHDAQFNLNKNITYDVDENGIATLTDKTTVKLNNSLTVLKIKMVRMLL